MRGILRTAGVLAAILLLGIPMGPGAFGDDPVPPAGPTPSSPSSPPSPGPAVPPAPVPAPAPAPQPKEPAGPDLAANTPEAQAKKRRQELDARRLALPTSAKPAMERLDEFRRREFRLWTTLRREIVELGPDAIPALLIGLDEDDWEVRAFSASCLADLKDPHPVNALSEAYARETKFTEAKRQFIAALAAIAVPEAKPVLLKAAAEADVGIRLAAVRGLARLLDPTLADTLRGLAKDADLDVKYEALGGLAALEDAATIDALVAAAEALVADRDVARLASKEIADDGDRYSQYLLGLALARTKDPRALKILLAAALADKPWEHKDFFRVGAADGWGRRALAGDPLPKLLVQGLAHDKAEVRLSCVRAVSGARSPEYTKRLAAVLSDSQLDVRHEAVVGLSRIPTPESVKALKKALSDKADEVRLAAVRALSAVRIPEATKALLEGAGDDKYMIRVLAVRELGWRSAEDGVIEVLVKAASDPDYGVREQAMAALAHAPDGSVVTKVLTKGVGDADPGVRSNACMALARLRNAPELLDDAPLSRKLVDLHLTTSDARLQRSSGEFLDAVRPRVAVDLLIAGLSMDTLEARKRANSALRKMSETDQGFVPEGPKSERDAAVEKWKTWWAGRGGVLPPRERKSHLVLTDSSLVEVAKDTKWKGLDIALLLDSTGSMAGLIRASKERIDEIIQELATLLPSLRISVYTYRDHGDDYLYYGTPLTYDSWKLSGFLQNATHGQGGDIPEAVYETVVNATKSLKWRPDAHKVVVYAGDAPHHPEQEGDFISKIKQFFTVKNQAQLDALFTDTNRRSLDIKARRERPDPAKSGFRSPFFENYQRIAQTGRGRAILLDDESSLIRELLVMAFGEPWRADIETILDFER